MEEEIEKYTLDGFDPNGEPTVRRTSTGQLWLCLELVPPSWVPDGEQTGPSSLGVWDDFHKRLAATIGVPVIWEDREWFLIKEPREDTVEAIHQFLLAERARLDPTPPEVWPLVEELQQWRAGAIVLTAEEVTAKKARLQQLSWKDFFRTFPEELGL